MVNPSFAVFFLTPYRFFSSKPFAFLKTTFLTLIIFLFNKNILCLSSVLFFKFLPIWSSYLYLLYLYFTFSLILSINPHSFWYIFFFSTHYNLSSLFLFLSLSPPLPYNSNYGAWLTQCSNLSRKNPSIIWFLVSFTFSYAQLLCYLFLLSHTLAIPTSSTNLRLSIMELDQQSKVMVSPKASIFLQTTGATRTESII